MKYFKDASDNVWAYENDGSQDHLIGDKTPISEIEANELNAKRQQAAFDALGYAEKRRSEYPSIGDQLDALFHAGVFPPEMAQRLADVKIKYPKN